MAAKVSSESNAMSWKGMQIAKQTEAYMRMCAAVLQVSTRLAQALVLVCKNCNQLLSRAVLPEVYCGHMILHLLQPLWWVKSFQSVDSDDVVQLIMKDGLDALIVESSG